MAVFTKGLFKSSSGGSGGGLTPEVQEALDTKANKATSLAGYGIKDAYTKLEVDSKLDTKQNTLSIEQLAAVNSGITAAHITAYDAYASEISQAQNDATKAENAAEVAQQTANLVGQNLQSVTEKIPTTASATNLLVDTSTLNTGLAAKANTEDLATVATTGSYNDLTDKPDAYSLPKASTTVLGGVKVDGTTITANAEGVITAVGGGGTGGTTDYTALTNKPQINSVELTGNKTLTDLGIQAAGDYALTSAIPTKVSQLQNDSNFLTSVPAEYVTETELNGKGYITSAALEGYAQTSDIPTATSELTNDSGFITNTVDNLTNYTPTSGLAAVATSGSFEDLNHKPVIPSEYTLPTASTTTLGGVKVDGTTITATPEGVISASGSTAPENAVTTDTVQTISAAKTFSADLILANNAHGIKSKDGGDLVGTWYGYGAQFGNTSLATTILSVSVPTVKVGAATSHMALFVTASNKESLPEATSSANMFGFLTETSTLVFCDGTAWKQITLTDLA